MIYKFIINGLGEDFKSTYGAKLGSLLEKAPSDASISTKISKMKKGYQGVLDVFSSQGKFVAKAIAKDPHELAVTLINQVYLQIVGWRKKRFSKKDLTEGMVYELESI